MITIDLICEACGEANPPGTQFCRNCNEYLAWDSPTPKLQPTAATTTAATGPTTPVVEGAAEQTVPIVEQTAPDQTPVDQGYGDQAHGDQAYDQQAYCDITCPACGTVNAPTRRYCSHCGYSFVDVSGADPSVDWSGWTPEATAARDREARRVYRRSLPPLYREAQRKLQSARSGRSRFSELD